MSGQILLQTKGLTKRFGGLVAVNNIGFDVKAGEILGLIGPNGSGKSTVMQLVMGVHRPTAGEILLDGENVAGWPSHKVARRGIGQAAILGHSAYDSYTLAALAWRDGHVPLSQNYQWLELAVYHGQMTRGTMCNDTGLRVYLYPTEYLSYGVSGTASIMTDPTGAKEYRIADHLGSVRAAVTGGSTQRLDY